MTGKKKRKIQKIIAFTLALLSLLAPCASVAAYIRRGDVATYSTYLQQQILDTKQTNHIKRECGLEKYKASETSAKVAKKLPIYCVDTKGQKKVAITFDAAWGNEDADQILNTLKENNVRATFFMVGDFIRKYPDLVKRIAQEGHDVANHSNKHPHVNKMTKDAIKEDIMGAHEEIKNLIGVECNLYRPPYGEYNDTVLDAAKECHYHTIQWDVDSIDWKGYDAPTIVKKVLEHKHLGDGSIILLHNGAKHTAEALPKIITGLKEKGYEIVPISELIYMENYTLDHEGRQSRAES